MRAVQNLILTEAQVSQIIRRIAFEIYENNFDEKKIILVGIYDKGYMLAGMIQKELMEIAKDVEIGLVRLDINKETPVSSEIRLDMAQGELKGMPIVLVDDVLNTGKTVAYSLTALLEVEVKRIETAVLVNRSHKAYPISANYKGYELSTSIDDHVDVRLEKKPAVYLY